MRIKCDPAKLPVPKLPPTKAVDIGADKLNYKPDVKKPSKSSAWSLKQERILRKLLEQGLDEGEIAHKMGKEKKDVLKRADMLKGRKL